MLLYGTSIIRLPDGLVSMMCNSDESNFHMLSTHPGCSRNRPLVPFEPGHPLLLKSAAYPANAFFMIRIVLRTG